mgnify:CR=1 FL=1|tara:strand:- start:183 stop:305 length:123 start_codon:yes stop_codon:yes gene_type:complete
MRKIINKLRLIFIEATYKRKYKLGKYIITVKPFSITITKK